MSRSRTTRHEPISLFSFQDVITCITGIMILVVMILVLEVVREKALAASPVDKTASETSALRQEVRKLEEEIASLSEAVRRRKAVAARLLADDPRKTAEDIERVERESERLKSEIAALRSQVDAQRRQLGAQAERLSPDAEDLEELRQRLARLKTENRIRFEFIGSDKTPVLVQCSRAGIKARVMGKDAFTHRFLSRTDVSPTDSVVGFSRWAESLPRDDTAFVVLVKPSAASYAVEVVDLLREKRFDVGYEPLEENRTPVFGDGTTF